MKVLSRQFGQPDSGAPPVEYGFLRGLFDGLRCGVVAVDDRGRIVLINGLAAQILDLDRHDLPGAPAEKVLAHHPQVAEVLRECFTMSCLPSRAELELTSGNGRNKTIGFTVSLVSDDENRQSGAAMFFKDLTQIEHKEEQSRLKDRLAALGQMAASLAHEIRNPLTFVQSAYDVITSDDIDTAKKEEINRRVQGEIARVNNRIEELLSLARIDSKQFTKIKLNDVMQNSVKMAEFKAHESDIKITARYDENHPVILGDSDKLSQLFQNLLINGIQAIDGSGEIIVMCSSDSNTATIDVEDSGSGIDPDSVEKIFDPFFSKKKKGTGLGLSISFSVARAHNGSLELRKTSSEGTCFRVTLPLTGGNG